MTLWFTSSEIALARLPGLPQTKRKVNAFAAREGWHTARDEAGAQLARRRAAKGGGFEFHVSLFPSIARARLEARAAKGKPEPRVAGPVITDAERRDARLWLLAGADQWRSSHASLTASEADTDFVRHVMSGQASLPDFVEAKVKRLSVRTLQHWRSLKARGDLALLGGRHGERRGAFSLDRLKGGEVADLVKGQIVAKPHVSAPALRKFVEHRFGAEIDGAPLPDVRSFQRFISAFRADNANTLLALHNPDKFKSHKRMTGSNAYGDVTRINQMWEIDASPVDALCVDGRHSLYALIDIWTRRLLTFVTRTPRTEASLLLIRRGIIEWGLPEIIKTDNGADFTSNRFVRAITSIGVAHWTTQAFSPEQKGAVERAIGTLQRGPISLVEGFIGHSVADAQQIRARKSFAQRLGETDDHAFAVALHSRELQDDLDRWTAGDYLITKHEGLGGKTPAERTAEAAFAPPRINNIRALDLLFADAGHRVVTKQGIRIDGALYFSGALEPGRRVMVRFDPRNMGRVSVFDEAGADFICEAVCPEREGIDPREAVARAQAERRRIMSEGKERLRALARQVKPRDMIEAVLELGERKARALPAPDVIGGEAHWTPALEGAAAAVAEMRDITPAAVLPEASNVVALPESPKQRFARALVLLERIERGETVDHDEVRWLGGYERTPEFKAHALMLEANGREWLEA